jgi:hypothetical protein
VGNAGQTELPIDPDRTKVDDIFAAARTIILADIVMSLDNVVALSAITQNNFQMLVVGLVLSIPILMFGSLYISRLLDVFPYLLWFGAAILGAVSGALIIEDPVFGGAFNSASSLANIIVPLLSAVFVVQISRVIVGNLQSMNELERPRALFYILFKRVSDAPKAPVAISVMAESPPSARVDENASEPAEPPLALATPELVQSMPVAPLVQASYGGGEHRVLIALGLFMVLAGGVLYYMLNAYEPPVPDRFITYVCKEPAMSISFRPSAREIRFSTVKGVVVTSVIDDRIVWDNYREAGARLAMPPPVKIVSADVARLVVNGGMFENTTCLATEQK